MDKQLVTELGMIKVSGIAVKLKQPENMLEQLVTELGIIKVSGIAVKFEQPLNISEQSVIELDIWMISIVFWDALKFEWLPVILIV